MQYLLKILVLSLMTLTAATLGGCTNTLKGAGKDIQAAGDALTQTKKPSTKKQSETILMTPDSAKTDNTITTTNMSGFTRTANPDDTTMTQEPTTTNTTTQVNTSTTTSTTTSGAPSLTPATD